jgi:hypothetical protein
MNQASKRDRAAAILEYPEGVLVVGAIGNTLLLPSKGFNRNESGMAAIANKLREQMGLFIHTAMFLFEHESTAIHYEVYWFKAIGSPNSLYPGEEMDYYQLGSNTNVYEGSIDIIKRYHLYKADNLALFQLITV